MYTQQIHCQIRIYVNGTSSCEKSTLPEICYKQTCFCNDHNAKKAYRRWSLIEVALPVRKMQLWKSVKESRLNQ